MGVKIDSDRLIERIEKRIADSKERGSIFSQGYTLALEHFKEVIEQEVMIAEQKEITASYKDSQALLNIIKGGKFNGGK